ncbi:MAG TPA: glycosyl hydrolase, partial [Alphaproteobacteria bacterium]|nr:glycosyl hydrolase [Alphaproteobacteria bacterium]
MTTHRALCLFLLIALACASAQNPASTPAAKPAKAEKKTTDKKKDAAKADAKQKDTKKAEGEAEKPADPMSSPTFGALKFRNVGPALVSGRVVSVAVNPHNKSQYFVGVASGGVWRTDNDGTTYQPVFEREGSYSIGTVVVDPKQPNVVWVGTGEGNVQRSVAYGDGIYRSEDSGKSWKNMGLKKSEHIGRILIDPRDSNVIYAAAQGPLWGPGGDRGLYKSTDGGKTWTAVLTISENTGVADVAMDPVNPDVLFASAYQRRRHVFTIIDGGPESALYKSIDAGKTWNKLSSGLPNTTLGRIGLAVSPVNHNLVYAIIETGDDKGGIYRSTDSGANWEKRNSYDFTPQYYSVLFADPKREDRLYAGGFYMQVSDDGGKTLHPLQPNYVHVDNHVIWVDPDDVNHMLLGNDGGLYTTRDGGATFRWASNLPTIQFYDVTVDNSKPFYYIYGGTQDNHSLGGPSRTRNASGITNQDWFITTQGDGFRSQVDPEDPNIVYAESQNGGLERHNRKTGEHVGIVPESGKGEMPQRWNWDSPII